MDKSSKMCWQSKIDRVCEVQSDFVCLPAQRLKEGPYRGTIRFLWIERLMFRHC